MKSNEIKQNSLKAWILAMRPKTLTGAAAPVLLGMALAWRDLNDLHFSEHFSFLALALAFLFAFLMQIDANLVNDFFDYVKGRDDEERLGPERACAQGWVTIEAMKRAIASCTVAACAVGLPLVYFGGLEMIAVGVLCVLLCFLYTTYMAQHALGDVAVLVGFGIIPVCVCYYLQCHTITWQVLVISIAMGIYTDRLLLVNNYRDIEQDKKAGKKTTAVMMGRKWTNRVFNLIEALAPIIVGAICIFSYNMKWVWVLVIGIGTSLTMIDLTTYQGRELNNALGKTARSIFLFGVAWAVLLVLF